MLEPILIVEDVAPTRIQLANLITEALDNAVRVETAETVQDAIDKVDRMADEGRSYSVAVVDVMVPDKPGAAPDPAERIVQCLVTRMPATLLIIVTGYASRQIALAQSLAITLIVIEVAVVVVAVSIVLCIYRRTAGIDSRSIREIKG